MFVLDSLVEVPGISVSGHENFVYVDNNNRVYGTESFLTTDVAFAGEHIMLWEIEDKTYKIRGHNVQKASINENIVAFYSNDIPISSGPYIFNSLPGLIIKLQDRFNTYEFVSIEKIEMDNFDDIVQDQLDTLKEFPEPVATNELLKFREIAYKSLTN